jgi:hypothetical protein
VQKEHRWLKSVISASAADMPALPWHRGNRRKPLAVKIVSTKSVAVAAR